MNCLLFCLWAFFFIHGECIDITNDVFGKFYEYRPAAFGDFDADKLTDIFVIEKLGENSHSIKILLSQDSPPYIKPSDISCNFNDLVTSVVPSDFNGDGAMDILAIVLKDSLYHGYILWGNITLLQCPDENEKAFASFKSQPLLFDYNGDMISDLVGEDEIGNRTYWIFNKDSYKPAKIPVTGDKLEKLRKPSAHAFVDLDGDLAADLWMDTANHFEFWSSSQNYFEYNTIPHPTIDGKSPKVIGQSSFLDIDHDGEMEVILPVCGDNSCSKSYLYVYDFSNTSQEWIELRVNFQDNDGNEWSFPNDRPSFLYTNTITPRVGDINLDGYPDILITLFNGNYPQVILMLNSECKEDCKYSRTFIPQWKTFDAWSYSVLGTFFDFEEDGSPDVLLVNTTKDGSKYTLAAYKDVSEYDATFVKVKMKCLSY